MKGLQIALVGPSRSARLRSRIRDGLAAHGLQCACAADIPELVERGEWQAIRLLVSLQARCGGREMDLAPALGAIVSPLLGYEWIDVDAATRRGIPVVNGEVAENRESVAEATILLVLASLYRLRETEALLRDPGAAPPKRGMLKGRRVGIIGYGGIARAIIERLAAWGCELVVHSRTPDPSAIVRFVSLDALLSTSDVIVVMTSLEQRSRHLLDAARLRKIKPGAILVNTSRGAIVDQQALAALLGSGRLAGAALDVFEVEPLPADDPLRGLPNTILTPHAISHTVESGAAAPACAVSNVVALLRDTLPPSCRNPGFLDHPSPRWPYSRA